MDRYYKVCGKPGFIPTTDQIEDFINKYPEHIIVVRNPEIKGVAIFVTLSDESYNNIEKFDISDVGVVGQLLQEQGENIHFGLVAADGLSTILAGIKEVKKKYKPKTISWWSPDMKHLHKFNLN